MPKVDPLIPDDVVLTRFEDLSPLLRLIPRQVSMVTALTIGQLEDYRKAGKPPRFTNEGGRVRYFIGDVRTIYFRCGVTRVRGRPELRKLQWLLD